VAPDAEPDDLLGGLCCDGLYLACACARLVPAALAHFENDLIAGVAETLRRRRLSDDTVEEVMQELRRDLLVADPPAAPKILEYSGSGDLGAWLRVVALRRALNHDRRERRQVPLAEEVHAIVAPSADPELEYVKRRYRAELDAALEAAIGALSTRDRTLLRLHYTGKLGLEAIGTMYGVHKWTVQRWLGTARTEVMNRTCDELARHLRLGRAELGSILRLVESQLDLSLATLLGGGDEPRE
jgi:RNA polymerase sigma-70 factor, ECF subfamily